MKILFAAACFGFLLLNGLLLNAAGVESRRCHCDDNGGDDNGGSDDNGGDNDDDQPSYNKLFVFGDSFADTGNLQKAHQKWENRGWFVPYGMSDEEHDNKPTGRCSDGMLQSDFLAKIILGEKKGVPPPERLRRHDGVDLSSGINFANSGSGVFPGWNLDTQIDRFRKLLRHKIISKDLSQSVALVSIASGADYADVPSDFADMDPEYMANVTDGIVDGVRQLQDLGIDTVLVNMLPPLGCAPFNTRADNYTKCQKDKITAAHNKHLLHKLGDDDTVLLLDLNYVFKGIVTPKTERLFLHRHTPCCESFEENGEEGFCGQVDGEGNLQYTLCDRPDKYFYWDKTNPTQAGWKAVMEQLEGPIREYLNI